jgi:HlyD family secretion protein
MSIVPQADELVIEARVRTQDIDEIVEGQSASVRFTAFNQRNTMQVEAQVIHVAADASRERQDAPPTFAVRLRLPADQLGRVGDLKLKPGMPADVFIQTRSRTPLSYLLQPLSDQIARSFREN